MECKYFYMKAVHATSGAVIYVPWCKRSGKACNRCKG